MGINLGSFFSQLLCPFLADNVGWWAGFGLAAGGMGAKAFQGLYSVIALIAFGSMIYFYRKCGREPPLWDADQAGWIVGTLVMPNERARAATS